MTKAQTKTKKNRGLAPTRARIAEMKGKGYALATDLARKHSVGESTIRSWVQRGRIDEARDTVKAYGNRWYSISAVEAICPSIPEANGRVTKMIIRVVDFETTGVVPPAEVIEVGICDISGPPWEVSQPTSYLCGSSLITAETRAIHHISPAEVVGRDAFAGVPMDGIVAVAAHRATFEAQWLGKLPDGVHLICTYKGALRVWPDAPAHSNQFLRYWLEEQGFTQPVAELCQPAHRAGPDAYATAWTLKALLDRVTGKELVTWTAEPALLPRITIGKERGKKWSEVDAGFLSWMLRQPDMDADLAWNASRELKRRAGEAGQ